MNNPIFKKEQKVRARSPKLMLLLVGYNLGLVILMAIAFVSIYGTNHSIAKYQDTLILYILIGVFQFALLLLIVPAFTAGTITGEKERQTFDVLITVSKNPLIIILGKLSASVSTMLLLIISSLPILAIAFSVGGLSLIDIILYVVVCFMEAAFIGSIGLFFSSFSKNTSKSIVLTYVTILLLVVGTAMVLGILYLIVSKQINYDEYSTQVIVTDLKNTVWLLLINPLVTVVALLMEQTGNVSLFAHYMNRVGSCNSFVLKHWVMISLGIQMVIGMVLIHLSAKNIDRIKK
jgi:ABC-type transport system involved in multi-copper enzyme maturation permease subunit